MNTQINSGLLKAVGQAHYYQNFIKTSETRVPEMLKGAILTSFVLQLISLFDEGVDDYVARNYPGVSLRWLHNRIEFLDAQGKLPDAAAAMRIKDRRNELAHESDKVAGPADWDDTYAVVHTALRHLGIVA